MIPKHHRWLTKCVLAALVFGTPASASAQVDAGRDIVQCGRIGTVVSVPMLAGFSKGREDAWFSALAFAEGALQGANFPETVDPFGTAVAVKALNRHAMSDSMRACYSAVAIGKVGPVDFVQILARFGIASLPAALHEVFVALGPDGGVALLGQDTVIQSPFRNSPEIGRLNTVLARYGLAGMGRDGAAQRLAVASLLFGGSPQGGITLRNCSVAPLTVQVVIHNEYGRSFTDLSFDRDGQINGVTRHEGEVQKC